MKAVKKTIGLIGGLGPLAGTDLLFKLVHASTSLPPDERFEIVFEQHDYDGMNELVDKDYNPSSRKFYVFNVIKDMEKRGVDLILLGCFISHTFLAEIQSEVKPKILNLFDAIRDHLNQQWSGVKRIGVLTSAFTKEQQLFEKNLPNIQLIYPNNQQHNDALTQAIYGNEGIKAGFLKGRSIDKINAVCQDLIEQDVELIIPGFSEIPIVFDVIKDSIATPLIDVNKIYAEYAINSQSQINSKDFKLGIVGGVGPAATVDFMDKVIALTKAHQDQDHIRMLVEHNPKIPDRTKNLIAKGTDPSISIYSACMKLEQGGANAIVIPCNTAHAFIDRVQPFLQIPIINMLEETAKEIVHKFPTVKQVGLLATTGTIQSKIYQNIFTQYGLEILEPNIEHQKVMMSVIYGEHGVKAGFTDGECKESLINVILHLINNGAEASILGCTELPLVIAGSDDYSLAGKLIPLLDPTKIVARKCVALATDNKLV